MNATAKRLFDVIAAASGLVVLSPVLLLLAVAVRLFLGSPVLFKQTRPGLAGQPFTLVKFRTMTDKRDEDGNLLPNAERKTRFGQFLRSTSLDELPELWNVLKGEMSLVGPRPLRMEYLPRYNAYQLRRHEVRPGITGWAQVRGRNSLTWEERFVLDVWYVDNQTFALDLRIIALTIWKVIARDSVSPHDKEFMEEFLGTVDSK